MGCGRITPLLHVAGARHDGCPLDPLVAAATVLLGSGIGTLGSPLTHLLPSLLPTPQGSPLLRHFAACYFAVSRLRDLCLLGMRYARKVRNSPESSIVADKMLKTRRIFWEIVQKRCWNLPHAQSDPDTFCCILCLYDLRRAVLGWWMAEISAVFLAAAVMWVSLPAWAKKPSPVLLLTAPGSPWCGTDYRHRPRYCGRDDNGMITHTILHSAENLVSGLPPLFSST